MSRDSTGLVPFLLARLDEIEQAANAAAGHSWHELDVDGFVRHDDSESTVLWADEEAHILLHDPAAVLADVAAKRAIIELHAGRHECVGDRHGTRGTVYVAPGYIHENDPTLLLLAQPYAAHPDFQDAWRIDVSSPAGGVHQA